jgi:hypothetical protein
MKFWPQQQQQQQQKQQQQQYFHCVQMFICSGKEEKETSVSLWNTYEKCLEERSDKSNHR